MKRMIMWRKRRWRILGDHDVAEKEVEDDDVDGDVENDDAMDRKVVEVSYLSLSFSDYLPTYLSIYLCIYLSIHLSLSPSLSLI